MNLADNRTIKRRHYLAALSTGVGASVSGCLGDDDEADEDDDGGVPTDDTPADLGEPVPEMQLEVMGGIIQSSEQEQAMEMISSTIEEELGLSTNIVIKEALTFWDETYHDNRSHSFHIDISPPFPENLDPDPLLRPFDIVNAGANGRPNVSQYASCEFSELLREQATASDEEERRNLIYQAISVASEDISNITLMSFVENGAYRTDQIEIPDPGAAGIATRNADVVFESTPIGDHDKIMNVFPSNLVSPTFMIEAAVVQWSQVVYSPLVRYDKNYNLIPWLATDWEVRDENREFEFTLREDATFHNGEPITAEDVVWTLQFLDDNFEQFPSVESQPYASLEAVSDHRVRITMEESTAPFLTAHLPNWGILPSDVWIEGGAEENPTDVDLDPIVGSGPYQVNQFEHEQLLDMEPYDDHWADVEGNLVYLAFPDSESAFRAFEQGEFNIFDNIPGPFAERIEDELAEVAELQPGQGFTSWELQPQHNFGPTMFTEFRHAVSEVLDRNFLNELLEQGAAEPELYSTMLGQFHPFYPEDPDEHLTRIAESAEGNPERAREILADEGWDWDDEGRLHYPPEADVDPLWPEDSQPCEHIEEFSCVEEWC